jgi:hypothetical protein
MRKRARPRGRRGSAPSGSQPAAAEAPPVPDVTTDGAQDPTGEGGDRALRARVNARTLWDVTQWRWGGARKRFWRDLLYRERPEPIPAFRGPIEPPPDDTRERIGICCSGGGIRSAAFNLGALQSLQSSQELSKACYLAAVSGGSYIAAAFAMVGHTWGEPGDPRPERNPANPYNGHDDSDPELIAHQPPFAPGSPEEQYLRNRSSYLAPDGFGKLFLVYRVILGLFFNVLFIATPLFAVMLILGWRPYRSIYPRLIACQRTCSYHVPLGCWLVPAAIAGVSVALGLLVLLRRLKRDGRRRALQVWSTRLLIAATLVALFTIGLPELVALTRNVGHELSRAEKALVAGGGGLAGLIAGVLAYVRETVLTPKKALEAIERGESALGSKVRLTLAYAAAALAGPLLVIGVMAFGLGVSLGYPTVPQLFGFLPLPPALGLAMLAAFFGVYFWTDLTALSLHPFYKRRLCTAFALKRVTAADAYGIGKERQRELREGLNTGPNPDRVRENATGGKEFLARSVAVERDFDTLVSLSKTALDQETPTVQGDAANGAAAPVAAVDGAAAQAVATDGAAAPVAAMDGAAAPAVAMDGVGAPGRRRRWPTLIVCAAANVTDPGATPPGRWVTSFTFSARSIGGPLIGALRTKQFERAFDGRSGRRRVRDLSLPAAVAISGAAIAPSMGKMTRRPLTFLLALANVRLGVWVPHPRWVLSLASRDERARERAVRRYGRPRPSYLIRELIGRSRVDSKYLFVTDGGHYENLGLVELLRRGCTEIYCFDASADGKFTVLGDAIALARSELDVEIAIDPSKLAPPPAAPAPANAPWESDMAEDNVAQGKILYRDHEGRVVREGVLFYARCVMSKGVPWDVIAHHQEDPNFPHNSTVDQLYTDQKFESYRVLGHFAGENAIARMGATRRRREMAARRRASRRDFATVTAGQLPDPQGSSTEGKPAGAGPRPPVSSMRRP